MAIQEASQRLGKSESTIRRIIRGGRLTAKKDGIYDISEHSVNDLLNDKHSVGNDQLSNELVKQLQDDSPSVF